MSEFNVEKINIKNVKDGDVIVIKTDADITQRDLDLIKTHLNDASGQQLKNILIIKLNPEDSFNIVTPPREDKLKAKQMHPDAMMPRRSDPEAAGFDLFTLKSMEPQWLSGGCSVKVATGVAFEFPVGIYGDVRSRSSAWGKGLAISGTIDENYRGEVFLNIVNTSNMPVLLEPGKAYAQMVLLDYHKDIEIVPASELSSTSRGSKGFGSTGNI